MLTEHQLQEWYEGQKYLEEKLIQFQQGGQGGQAVFLAGGAGSGKSFAINKFIRTKNFKIFDVDQFKQAFVKLGRKTDKFPELKNLDLSNPKDVLALHTFVKNRNIENKVLDAFFSDRNPDRLPNVMFDITLKDLEDIEERMPRLEKVGYEPKNIHIVWVLTDFYVAMKNNQSRERIVPDDVVLKTHEGAAQSMYDIIDGAVPRGIDGDIHIILNNREETVKWEDPKTGRAIKPSGTPIRKDAERLPFVVKDFASIRIKDRGKPMRREKDVNEQVLEWIRNNVPDSALDKMGIK